MLIELTKDEASIIRGLIDIGFKAGGIGFAREWGERVLALDAKIVAADQQQDPQAPGS